MKFDDIPAPRLSLRVKPLNAANTLRDGPVLSIKTATLRGEFELYTKTTVATVMPTNSADVNPLTDVLATGCAILAQLTNPAPDGSTELQLVLFNGEQLEMGELEIGIDEKVMQAVEKIAQLKSLDKIAQYLQEQCVFKLEEKTFFFMFAGESAKAYLEKNIPDQKNNRSKGGDDEKTASADSASDDESSANLDEESEEAIANDKAEYSNRHFAVLGANISFALAEKEKTDGQTIFLASRIRHVRNQQKESGLRIACGNLKFLDWTAAGERAMLAKAQLEKLLKNDGSYLKKWDEFGNIEDALLLERARAVGEVTFEVTSENKDGTITIQCDSLTPQQKEALANVSEIEITDADETPEYLTNPSMTFNEYIDTISNKNTNNVMLKVEYFNVATSELLLRSDSKPSGTKFIYSIVGELAQSKRRMQARKLIQTTRSANPNLGLLIEENGDIPPCQPPPKMKPLTAFVRKKVFRDSAPTMAQERAIEVALNTPDIALIQGPPGTGKTTVIAAIVERLNEESDKRSSTRGSILLSGFQHDAVENMIRRMAFNGLPVPKYGQRSGEAQNADLSRFEKDLQAWFERWAEKLRVKNPQINESLEEKHLRGLCVQYLKTPTLTLAKNLLEAALKRPDSTLGEDLRKRLQVELKRIKSEQNDLPKANPHLTVVRGIRVTTHGFSDDGPDRAADALFALRDELDEADKSLLAQAQKWRDAESPPFLKELKALRDKCLIHFTPAPMYRVEKARDTVVELIQKTIARIRSHGFSAKDKKNAALVELLLEVENNPSSILEAVSDYSFAFAATCQQSVNKLMQEVKGINPNVADAKMEYQFVIIDEAARVSPRDLMIPMAQGKRIILVGDHRQLPQLIDEEVAARMEKEKTTILDSSTGENSQDDRTPIDEQDWLKKSMFEYLFTERLPQLEQTDGITRHVTLDKQYRMHPLLGDFISRNFYERFNHEEKFGSGRPESDFAHNLPGTNGKCAAWLDVPLKSGQMVNQGTSKTRPAEADAICAQLKKWMTCEEGKGLSFGVIAFYKAQTELIKQKLGNKFFETTACERLPSGEERLRVGTVDSFQGMEFDVVFLSLVRTEVIKTGVKSFGFLKVYNRLNVSMSRQKKLLVAVGDAAFYDTAAGREEVPSLADFLNLCRTKGVVM